MDEWYLEHGILSRMKEAKEHKYIDRKLSSTGKVVYIYNKVKKQAKNSIRDVSSKASEKYSKIKASISDNKKRKASNSANSSKSKQSEEKSVGGLLLTMGKVILDKIYKKTDSYANSRTSALKLINSVKEKLDKKKYGKEEAAARREINDKAAEVNPKYESDSAYQVNCPSCALAYEMRSRGYEVEASNANGSDRQTIQDMYEGETVDRINIWEEHSEKYSGSTVFPLTTREARDIVEEHMLSLSDGEDSRGAITFYYNTGGGHILNYEVKNGKVYVVESQNGEGIWSDDTWDLYLSNIYLDDVEIIRLDNAEINDWAVYERTTQ